MKRRTGRLGLLLPALLAPAGVAAQGDNGQVWQVSDHSQGFVPPGLHKVRVRRGALGAFYLEIDGVTRSPRVRRVE